MPGLSDAARDPNGGTAGSPFCGDLARRRFEVRGRVQGVGFRPFVCRLASEIGLGGLVGNDPGGAFVEVEGPAAGLAAFEVRLRNELPPLARIAELVVRDIPCRCEGGFRIVASSPDGVQEAEITPDTATCEDCLRELLDPNDRRYRYPFINCTNCGPRYSIIQAVPYDRPNTTMSVFKMCPACQAEYEDPANRRFHAQPNACPVCGPRVWLTDGNGQDIPGDAVRLCARYLSDGAIVAIKGIGGFHLACRADCDEPVRQLRERKGREAKPLALMVASIKDARALANIDEASASVLCSAKRPIVLLDRRLEAPVSEHVAPGMGCLGIMLPYAPLHHLLFAEGLGPLVMTSANPTDEPLCAANDEALQRLVQIADAFLLHDRDIERRVDDSVVMVMPETLVSSSSGTGLLIRRARGYAPAPIRVPVEAPVPVLGVGGELKSTVCLLTGADAVVSEHLGELSNPATYRNFVQTIAQFRKLLRVDPQVVAYDMHPEYVASRYARELGLPVEPVQHHHAHVVSCMADTGIRGRVIGISCDGTGYGPDGGIWGCEVLTCDEAGFERSAHLRYFPLLGGDLAARDTWRPAAGLLWETLGEDWRHEVAPLLKRVDPEAIALVDRRLRHRGRLVETSSMGRLFDAVAFLLGICDRNRYEAEAAMMLETIGRSAPATGPLAYSIQTDHHKKGPVLLDPRPMIRELLAGQAGGRRTADLVRAFHETLAAMLADVTGQVAQGTGLTRVVLSGGCFANRLLLERLSQRLRQLRLDVYVHGQIPTGDGGIALGQAVAVAERLRRR